MFFLMSSLCVEKQILHDMYHESCNFFSNFHILFCVWATIAVEYHLPLFIFTLSQINIYCICFIKWAWAFHPIHQDVNITEILVIVATYIMDSAIAGITYLSQWISIQDNK